jgi:hypothetical protein
MWNMLHGFEPVVRIAKLCNDKSLVGISIRRRILKPMFVSSQLGSNLIQPKQCTEGEFRAGKKETPRRTRGETLFKATYLNRVVEAFYQMAMVAEQGK